MCMSGEAASPQDPSEICEVESNEILISTLNTFRLVWYSRPLHIAYRACHAVRFDPYPGSSSGLPQESLTIHAAC
jgi:hypothetical protein